MKLVRAALSTEVHMGTLAMGVDRNAPHATNARLARLGRAGTCACRSFTRQAHLLKGMDGCAMPEIRNLV